MKLYPTLNNLFKHYFQIVQNITLSKCFKTLNFQNVLKHYTFQLTLSKEKREKGMIRIQFFFRRSDQGKTPSGSETLA